MANVILGGILKRLYTKVYMKKVKNVTEYISIWKQRTEGYTLKLYVLGLMRSITKRVSKIRHPRTKTQGSHG